MDGKDLYDALFEESDLTERANIANRVIASLSPSEGADLAYTALNIAVDRLRVALEVVIREGGVDGDWLAERMKAKLTARSADYADYQFNRIVAQFDDRDE